MSWLPHISHAASGFVEALLIGALIGAQRETQKEEGQPGLRDFVLIAIAGGVCGLLEEPWLTGSCLVAIVVLLTVYYLRVPERSGITTEMAAVATFVLCVLTATPGNPAGGRLAVGAAIVVVASLEAKRSLHRFVRETITETEFNDTIRFLAIIFIIYPLLPEGAVGPNEVIEPRQVWTFVILVSSISYVGYFFQKFLGQQRGLLLTSILGGLASTTAATLAFSREVRERPEALRTYWSAAVLANAIQFPRIVLILSLVNVEVAQRASIVLLIMTALGLLLGRLLYPGAAPPGEEKRAEVGNPFRLGPALKFGALFAAIVVASKLAAERFGGEGFFWAAALGGTIDADAVTVSAASLQASGEVEAATAVSGILLALFMNAVLKSGLAAYAGGLRFGWRVALGFAAMFGAGGVAVVIRGI